MPFVWDEQTLGNGLNFTLMTDLGELDLLGEITGAGNYDELEPGSVSVHLFGRDCRVIGLDDLIRAKHAAGRPKDYEALAELELLRDLRNED